MGSKKRRRKRRMRRRGFKLTHLLDDRTISKLAALKILLINVEVFKNEFLRRISDITSN